MYRLPSLLFLCFFVFGCSSSRVVLAPSGGTLPLEASMAPLDLEVELTRENARVIKSSLMAALRNRGFLIQEGTGSSGAVVRASIETFRRTSGLIGHVNSIGGRIQFIDGSEKVLAESEHTETDRGGLLFNSGQLFKAFRSEADNLQEKNFEDWVDRFAEGLVRTLPRPEQGTLLHIGEKPVIDAVKVTSRGAIREVCLQGTSGGRALLLTGSFNLPLLESGASGRYCTRLPSYVDEALLVSSEVELSSSSGVRAQKPIGALQVDSSEKCSIQGIQARVLGDMFRIQLLCEKAQIACRPDSRCPVETFRVYEVEPSGAFAIVAEFQADDPPSAFSSGGTRDGNQFRAFRILSSGFPQPVLFSLIEGS